MRVSSLVPLRALFVDGCTPSSIAAAVADYSCLEETATLASAPGFLFVSALSGVATAAADAESDPCFRPARGGHHTTCPHARETPRYLAPLRRRTGRVF